MIDLNQYFVNVAESVQVTDLLQRMIHAQIETMRKSPIGDQPNVQAMIARMEDELERLEASKVEVLQVVQDLVKQYEVTLQ